MRHGSYSTVMQTIFRKDSCSHCVTLGFLIRESWTQIREIDTSPKSQIGEEYWTTIDGGGAPFHGSINDFARVDGLDNKFVAFW